MTSIVVCIPVHNQEQRIEEVLHRIRNNAPTADIVVIDDGSRDNTYAILKRHQDLYVIRHNTNRGYGAALKAGFSFAVIHKYDYIITIDSDKQHQPSDIPRFLKFMDQSYWDIISGSRYLQAYEDTIKEAPADRMKVNKKITQKINAITGWGLTDAFCGFKMYKVSAIQNLHISEEGFGMPLQLWMQAWKHGLRIKEVPVQLIYNAADPSQMVAATNMCQRYKYYLKCIQQELENNENTNFSSAS